MDKKDCFKISLVGGYRTGKTNIMRRYCQNKFISIYIMSIGVDFMKKQCLINELTVTTSIWDIFCNSNTLSIPKAYIKRTSCILQVIDVSDKTSFDCLKKKLSSLVDDSDNDQIVYLIGNKVDIKQREISKEEALQYANEKKCKYYECSALTGENISEIFFLLIREMINKQLNETNEKKTLFVKNKNENNNGKKSKHCLIF